MTMNDRRITFIIESLVIGGAERVVCNLASEFDRNGWEVNVVVTRATGPMAEVLPDSVKLINLESSRTLASIPHLVQYFRRNRPDAVIANLTHVNVVTTLAVRLARIDASVAVVEHNVLSNRIERISGRKELVTAKLAKHVYPWAEAIIAVSDGTADNIASVTGIDRSKISTIYNPIVSDDLTERAKKPVDHPWFEQEDPIILGVGSLSEQKNFPLLIRAFNEVVDEREARLMIIGEGDDRSELEALASELGVEPHIDLLGYVDNPYKYMNHADVFVLSSAWEGFGNVIVEAMACGTPIVSTDCESGPAEILGQGEWGRLTAIGDTEGMATAILETISEPTDVDKLTNRASSFSTTTAYRKYAKRLGIEYD